MADNICQDVNAHVERIASVKMAELEERLSKFLSEYATEAYVKAATDALKALLAGTEVRFQVEHTALAEAINEQKAVTKAQTALLEALSREVKAMSETFDALCEQRDGFGNIEGDVASIAGTVQAVEKKTDTVTSFVSSLNNHLDDIRLVVEQKANEVRKVQEERRKADEAARQKEEQEREQRRKAEEAVITSFSGKDSEIMAKGVNALKEWTGKARAMVIYDSTVEPFTVDGLFNKVKEKQNIAVVGFTTEGDVFGGFYTIAAPWKNYIFEDPNIFAFSFESHGRCETPQRFVPNEEKKEHVHVYFATQDSHGFVRFDSFGGGALFLGNESSESYCKDLSRTFEGLEDTTLTGKSGAWGQGPYHHFTRLVAIQLE